MSDEAAGKKLGAAGLGLAGIVALLARSADDCGRVAVHGAPLADDVARGVGRGASAVDDVAFAAGRGGRAAVPVPGLGGVGDDALRLGSSGHDLEESLIQAGLELGVELLPLGPELGPDDEPGESPSAAPPRPARSLYMGAPSMVSLVSVVPAIPAGTRLHVVATAPGTRAELLQELRSQGPVHGPVSVLGRATADRSALVMGPSAGAASVAISDVVRACARDARPCVVVACEHDAGPECDEAAASMWKSAALALPGARGSDSLAELIDLDYGVVVSQLVRGLLQARAAAPQARGAFIARVAVGARGAGVVLAGGTIPRAATPAPVAPAAPPRP